MIAKRLARGFEIVDLLREAVPGDIDSVTGQPIRAGTQPVAPRAHRLLGQDVVRVADRRLDLGAVEPRRAVDPAVTDEDDVVVVREPARPGEFHVGDAGAAFEAEDRLRRVVRPCTDASHRQGDQPRLRVGPVLGHDERPAVGAVVAVLGRVVAALQRQVAGLRTCWHGDVGVRRESEVGQPGDGEGDQRQRDDSTWSESSTRRADRASALVAGRAGPWGVDACHRLSFPAASGVREVLCGGRAARASGRSAMKRQSRRIAVMPSRCCAGARTLTPAMAPSNPR